MNRSPSFNLAFNWNSYQEFLGIWRGAGTSQNPQAKVDGKVRRVDGYTFDILTAYAIDFIGRQQKQALLI